MLKFFIIIFSVAFSSAALADAIEWRYDSSKPSNCRVWAGYIDGDKLRETCKVQDYGTYRAAGTTVRMNCESSGQVGHLSDGSSSITLLANCNGIKIKEARAYKTRGKNKSKGTSLFGRRKNSDAISHELSGNTQWDDCFKRVDISGDEIRILVNSKHQSNSSCKRVVYND